MAVRELGRQQEITLTHGRITVNRRDFIKAASVSIAVRRRAVCQPARLQKTVRKFGFRWACCMTPHSVRGLSGLRHKSVRIISTSGALAEGANWSNNDKLSPYTNNVIGYGVAARGGEQDQEESGYAYIKKQCMPALISLRFRLPGVGAEKDRKPASSTMTRCLHRLPLLYGCLPYGILSTTTTTRLCASQV